jgi:hypothetical protein
MPLARAQAAASGPDGTLELGEPRAGLGDLFGLQRPAVLAVPVRVCELGDPVALVLRIHRSAFRRDPMVSFWRQAALKGTRRRPLQCELLKRQDGVGCGTEEPHS